jgi:Arc/MetJ-type ribon-helix-helix transcriptional regulator
MYKEGIYIGTLSKIEETINRTMRDTIKYLTEPTTFISSQIPESEARIIDILVKAGIFKNRSEAVAFFVHRGIESSKELLYNTKKQAKEIKAVVYDPLSQIGKNIRELINQVVYIHNYEIKEVTIRGNNTRMVILDISRDGENTEKYHSFSTTLISQLETLKKYFVEGYTVKAKIAQDGQHVILAEPTNTPMTKGIKCPFCGYEGELTLIKNWRFNFYDVKMFECPKCKGRFNHYVHIKNKTTSFVIKIKPKK